MTATLLGLLSGWIVLRVFHVSRSYPWRLTDLEGPSVRSGPMRSGSVRSAPIRSSTRMVPGHAGPIARGRLPQTSRERRELRAVEADLPAAADMLHIAVTAGHTLHGSVAAVARSGTGPVCEALAEADRRFRNGCSLVDELDRLPDRLGPSVRSLSTTLVVASSSGAPLGPTLQRLADSERRRLRRRTEERVRRLPVLLLAPLVGLVLPAFVLLTVIPVAITTAGSGLVPLTEQPSTAVLDLPPSSSDTFRSPP